jgi:hypothetical protein
MSEAIKHVTPGPWKPDFKQIGLVTAENGAEVAKCKRLTGLVELQDRARLIAEAGTVHHETGLTPRQLVEQRDALAGAIEALLTDVKHDDDGSGYADAVIFSPDVARARAALALVKGEKP